MPKATLAAPASLGHTEVFVGLDTTTLETVLAAHADIGPTQTQLRVQLFHAPHQVLTIRFANVKAMLRGKLTGTIKPDNMLEVAKNAQRGSFLI